MRFLAILALAVIGCRLDPTELEENRELWAQTGGDSYEITVQRSCFCPDVDPIQVTVVDGEVTQALRLVLDAEPAVIDPADYEPWFTVEGLFAIADEALIGADVADITYDATLGFPTAIEIDWYTDAVDDETSYFATALELGVAEPQ